MRKKSSSHLHNSFVMWALPLIKPIHLSPFCVFPLELCVSPFLCSFSFFPLFNFAKNSSCCRIFFYSLWSRSVKVNRESLILHCTICWINHRTYGAQLITCAQAWLPPFFNPCVASYALDLAVDAFRPAAKWVGPSLTHLGRQAGQKSVRAPTRSLSGATANAIMFFLRFYVRNVHIP